MDYPQIIMIAFMSLGVGIHMTRHGECRDGKYNGIAKLIQVAILSTILYLGGFWS